MVTAGATAILSPRIVNDVRANWSRATGDVDVTMDEFHGAIPPPVSSLVPGSQMLSTFLAAVQFPNGFGTSRGNRVSNAALQVNVVDTVSMVAGAHQLKFGIDFRHVEPTNRGASGYVVILNNFAQLQAGTMGLVGRLASDQISAWLDNWSLFAQDTWSVSPRLTVTYGLRWDINTPPVSTDPDKPLYAVEGIFDSKSLGLAPAGTPLWRTRYTAFAPRGGVAFQLSPSTTVRGGGGLIDDLGYSRFLGSLMFGFPYNRARTTSAVGQRFDLSNPVFAPPALSTSLATFTVGNLSAFDPGLRLPSTVQWNAAIERELGWHQSLTMTYVGAHGRELLRPDFVVPPELRAAGAPPISATRNAGRSDYAALQVQFLRRLTRGLQALASYTLAKASDVESDDGGGNFFGASWNANSATTLDRIQLPPLAPSDFDVRHTLAAAVSYEIPPVEVNPVAHAILRDWAVDSIVRVSSALPLNVRI
jgi:hypothetical protein